jgi:plasmid stabilization system protein ParE
LEAYEISWTTRATKDLRKVYDFNIGVIGEEKAFGLILLLLERVDMLSDQKFVRMGTVDEEFKHLKRGYKKLIEGNIKITYRISRAKSIVYVNRVFDTRQDPRKNR